jgi:hypothetical protein
MEAAAVCWAVAPLSGNTKNTAIRATLNDLFHPIVASSAVAQFPGYHESIAGVRLKSSIHHPNPSVSASNLSVSDRLEQYRNWFAFAEGVMSLATGFQCAGCGEWNETVVDESAGSRQNYVEDCQVCCKPNVLSVVWDISARVYDVSAELES